MAPIDWKKRRRTTLSLAIALAIVLYAAGLFSGLYVSKTIEARQEENLLSIKADQKESYDSLLAHVNNLETNLQQYQLQERFMMSLDQKQACTLAETYFTNTLEGLTYYWQTLPSRLETYERENKLTPDYIALKKRYTALSLRVWMTARTNYNNCDTNIIPVLYFYAADCESCAQQGELLDTVREVLAEQNKTVLVFTIDSNADEPVIPLIKTYYNINQTPAVVVNEHVLQGTLIPTENILSALNRSKP